MWCTILLIDVLVHNEASSFTCGYIFFVCFTVISATDLKPLGGAGNNFCVYVKIAWKWSLVLVLQL